MKFFKKDQAQSTQKRTKDQVSFTEIDDAQEESTTPSADGNDRFSSQSDFEKEVDVPGSDEAFSFSESDFEKAETSTKEGVVPASSEVETAAEDLLPFKSGKKRLSFKGKSLKGKDGSGGTRRFLSFFKKDKKHFIIYGASALVFVVAVVTAVLLLTGGETEAQVSYEDVAVSTQTIDRTLTAAGEITYADTETVSFSTSKTFTAMCVETEDAVTEGQKLAKYSDGTYLTADCNGVVSAISAPETGDTATSSNSITICPTDELILDITVPEDEIDIVAEGDEAEVIVNADTSVTYDGTITYIGGAASGSLSTSSDSSSTSDGSSTTPTTDTTASAGSTGTTASSSSSDDSSSYFDVTITLANDGSLKLGMSGSCTIMLESKEDVIAVPIEAVYFDDDNNPYVNVVESDGTLKATTVETGISDATYVEITSGLDGDETVQVEKIG